MEGEIEKQVLEIQHLETRRNLDDHGKVLVPNCKLFKINVTLGPKTQKLLSWMRVFAVSKEIDCIVNTQRSNTRVPWILVPQSQLCFQPGVFRQFVLTSIKLLISGRPIKKVKIRIYDVFMQQMKWNHAMNNYYKLTSSFNVRLQFYGQNFNTF